MENIILKEGDIFKWFYKNDLEYRRNNQNTAYWCMDNQCVVRDGVLIDTYWLGVDLSASISSNAFQLDISKIDLEFVCNLYCTKFIKEYEIEDYDRVYNLSYQKGCYKVFAIDKDAQVSKKALRAKYVRKLEEAEYHKQCAERDIEKYTNYIKDLENA